MMSDDRSVRYAHAGAERPVEHPVRDFLTRPVRIVFRHAVQRHIARPTPSAANDDPLPVHRMPGVLDLKNFVIGGTASGGCSTRNALTRAKVT